MFSWTKLIAPSLQSFQWAAGFADLLLKSLVILTVVGGVCLCARRRSASLRHFVWFLAMAGLLVLPGLARTLPAWQKPLWRVATRVDSQNELTLTLEFPPAGAMAASQTQAPVVRIPAADTARGAGGQRLATHFRADWAMVILAVWMGGAAIVLLTIASGYPRLGALRRAAHAPVDARWLHLLHELPGGRRVRLLQSDDNVMPVTWGWWRPVILLPADADQWPLERRKVVLLHELAHVRRGDSLTQLIARLACAIYWFNPLVWMAARRMRDERERACDDLVLEGGFKASDYAAQLVEIAQTFQRTPRVPAIAMARSSRLEGRIAGIVDASRIRRAPGGRLRLVCGISALAFVGMVAAQKPGAGIAAVESGGKPWYDARLRAFFAAKETQARKLAAEAEITGKNTVIMNNDPAEQRKLEAAAGKPVPGDAWSYFDAGGRGDWQSATNLLVPLRGRSRLAEFKHPDTTLNPVLVPLNETDMAWHELANWRQKYALAFANDLINTIPPGSIYFGGTAAGRAIITALSESQVDGKPFFTLTQNALADGDYLVYLRSMYGAALSLPTPDDSQSAFSEYMKDARRRYTEHRLRPGEDVQVENSAGHRLTPTDSLTEATRVTVSGTVAIFSLNSLLVKVILDRNPGREVYLEESYPLDSLYPYLTPSSLIMKLNHQALDNLPDDVVLRDHEYWSRYVQPMLGDWLTPDTSIAEVAAFAEKVYLRHDLSRFTGDPEYLADEWAQSSFGKLRLAIAGIYDWRATNSGMTGEKERMSREAEFAHRQAYALNPASLDVLSRYVQVLVDSKRRDDALLLINTSLKLDPDNDSIKKLWQGVKDLKPGN